MHQHNMKISIFFTSIFILATRLNAIDFYTSNDLLYVWANRGLNIRDSNSIRGNVIGTIGYNEKVIVLTNKFYNDENSILLKINNLTTRKNIYTKEDEKEPIIEITGIWVKVNYNGLIGYVFDGYLSRLQGPSIYAKVFEQNLKDLFENNFGIISEKDSSYQDHRKIENYYHAGISYINKGANGGFNSTYIIPNVSVDEILLLLNNTGLDGIGTITRRKSKDLNGRIYLIDSNESNYHLTIIETKNATIIEVSGSC
jgi:hypothetical protein